MPVAFSDASDRVSNNQDEAGPSSSKEQPRAQPMMTAQRSREGWDSLVLRRRWQQNVRRRWRGWHQTRDEPWRADQQGTRLQGRGGAAIRRAQSQSLPFAFRAQGITRRVHVPSPQDCEIKKSSERCEPRSRSHAAHDTQATQKVQ